MVDSIAGKPLVIGNSVATSNSDGTVKIKNGDGTEKNLTIEEFKQYLIANAPKQTVGDTVSFKGDGGGESGGETSGSMGVDKADKESKKSGSSVLGALLVGCIADVAGYFGMSHFKTKPKLEQAEKLLTASTSETVKKRIEASVEKLKANRKNVGLACAAGAVVLYSIGKSIFDNKKEF